jgi:cytochrome c oxidase subunit 4
MAQATEAPRTYLLVFIGLLGLTAATLALCHFDLGQFHTSAGLGIAAGKAILVVLFFMHAWRSTHVTWLVAISGLFWLALLIGLTLTDLLSRNWPM